MDEQSAFSLLKDMLTYAQLLIEREPTIARQELADKLVERFGAPYVSSNAKSSGGCYR